MRYLLNRILSFCLLLTVAAVTFACQANPSSAPHAKKHSWGHGEKAHAFTEEDRLSKPTDPIWVEAYLELDSQQSWGYLHYAYGSQASAGVKLDEGAEIWLRVYKESASGKELLYEVLSVEEVNDLLTYPVYGWLRIKPMKIFEKKGEVIQNEITAEVWVQLSYQTASGASISYKIPTVKIRIERT